MSTRSQLQFGYLNNHKFEREAQIYHHYDGYPSARLVNIKEAIDKAHGNYTGGYSYRVKDTYPSDLAAFYILTHKYGAGNIEVDEHIHSDIEYMYQIWQEDDGKFMVRILQPTGGEFWDEPTIDKMSILDEGELETLIEKYKEN